MAIICNSAKREHQAAPNWADNGDDKLIRALLAYEINARTLRARIFAQHVFNGSSWTLAQHLFAAHLNGEKMRTKELCAISGLPQTTVLRYLDHLGKLDLIRREPDRDDSRVTLITMTDWGARWLRQYYSQVIASEKRLSAKGHGLLSLLAKSAEDALAGN
jgi:DNA-binding MarR family transcriptional regulator